MTVLPAEIAACVADGKLNTAAAREAVNAVGTTELITNRAECRCHHKDNVSENFESPESSGFRAFWKKLGRWDSNPQPIG